MSSDTLMIGSPDNDSALDGPGYVDVYALVNGSWTWKQSLTPSPTETNSNPIRSSFGRSLSLSGSTLVVSADEFMIGAGRAFVFEKQPDGTFAQVQELSDGTDQMDEDFGDRVVVRGDTMVVTRPTTGASPPPRAGRAYVYVRAGTTWNLQQVLKMPMADDKKFDGFGGLADLGDDHLAVASQSAVYVFSRSGVSWTLTATLQVPSKPGASASAVAISPGTTPDVYVGDPSAELNGLTGAGDVIVIRGNPPGDLQLHEKSPAKNHRFGAGLALSGTSLLVAAGDISSTFHAALAFGYW